MGYPMDFTEFALHEELLKGIQAAGYVTCTPVQEQVLNASQQGADLYVQSQTGTGKTAAYLVSIIQEMLSKSENGAKALILVPTRELAVQVEEEAKTLLSGSKLFARSFYGGVGYDKQVSALKKGVDIIIGTPGRVIDLEQGGQMDLSGVAYLVIDVLGDVDGDVSAVSLGPSFLPEVSGDFGDLVDLGL